MNKAGKRKYSNNWEKLSRRLRLLYPCAICGETDFSKKETHHKDFNKKNGDIGNAVVLCLSCHRDVHSGEKEIPKDFEGYQNYKQSFKIAKPSSVLKEWFNPKAPLVLIPNLPSKIGLQFRKDNIKGI